MKRPTSIRAASSIGFGVKPTARPPDSPRFRSSSWKKIWIAPTTPFTLTPTSTVPSISLRPGRAHVVRKRPESERGRIAENERVLGDRASQRQPGVVGEHGGDERPRQEPDRNGAQRDRRHAPDIRARSFRGAPSPGRSPYAAPRTRCRETAYTRTSPRARQKHISTSSALSPWRANADLAARGELPESPSGSTTWVSFDQDRHG